MENLLTRRWWTILIRGIAAVLFGILTFVVPQVSLFVLVMLFGAYALVDGIFAIAAAVRAGRGGEQWGALLFEGIVGIAAGVVVFLWPAISALSLLIVIGAWAIVTGVLEIVSAIRLRKIIQNEWLLGLAGVLSIAFGVLCFVRPKAGALAITLYIGAYALVFGALEIALAFRLRSFGRAPAAARPAPQAPYPAPA
jgi:uncharacterized membrane protein HdeD (DUF308 family)